MIGMMFLKKKGVQDDVLRCIVRRLARRHRRRRHRHLYTVVVIDVQLVRSMIQQMRCVVDMVRVVVRKVNVAEKDRADTQEVAAREDILVLVPIKRVALQPPML